MAGLFVGTTSPRPAKIAVRCSSQSKEWELTYDQTVSETHQTQNGSIALRRALMGGAAAIAIGAPFVPYRGERRDLRDDKSHS